MHIISICNYNSYNMKQDHFLGSLHLPSWNGDGVSWKNGTDYGYPTHHWLTIMAPHLYSPRIACDVKRLKTLQE